MLRLSGFLKGLFAALAMVATLGSAHATLLTGKTVSFQYAFPSISSAYGSSANGNYVVGSGVEIQNGFCCGFEGKMDFSDTGFQALFQGTSSYTSSSFNGFRVSDVFGQIASFTSVTVGAATNMVGFDASRITFDNDNIWINWQGLAFNPNTVVAIELNGGNDVPEPGIIALIGLALAGVAVSRRRQES